MVCPSSRHVRRLTKLEAIELAEAPEPTNVAEIAHWLVRKAGSDGR